MRLAICVLILVVVLSDELQIDMALGAFIAGAMVRAALDSASRRGHQARLDGLGSAFLVPIFFVTAGVRLDVASLFSDPSRADDGAALRCADADGTAVTGAAALPR